MKENVGQFDRILRFILGPSLVAASLTQIRKRPILAVLGAVAGAIVTETAVTRVCPINTALGIDSRSTTEHMRDFRTEVNEESERITSTYDRPLVVDDTSIHS